MFDLRIARPLDAVVSELTAADLMSPELATLDGQASVREAAALLSDRPAGAVVAVDYLDRPLGVLDAADIVQYTRERPEGRPVLACARASELRLASGERLAHGFQVECPDEVIVQDMMTPAVFSVPAEAPLSEVAAEMVGHSVHQVFVTNRAGELVGMVDALDVLRHLTRSVTPCAA